MISVINSIFNPHGQPTVQNPEWEKLFQHFQSQISQIHLRDLLQDSKRCQNLQITYKNFVLDLSHQKMNEQTLDLFQDLYDKLGLKQKITDMFEGVKINKTEGRAVLHTALRASPVSNIQYEGKNVVPDVHAVLGQIKEFSSKIRSQEIKGFSGKQLTNVIVIGIGGSYLSLEFVYEALRNSSQGSQGSKGMTIRFLANVDPVDFVRATQGLSAENTIIVINSKTFTTAETMLNSRTVKNWLISEYKKLGTVLDTDEQIEKLCQTHFCAASTNLELTSKFGIAEDRVFGFWDWVGGRFSVWSAVGVLPLSIFFGYEVMEKFLEGGRDMDQHLINTPLKFNLPLLLGFVGFYNTSILRYQARAILPYSQSLCKFVPHIQQLDMESNGKRVSVNGQPIPYECTVINFGEPGTNGQHSFYQLLHQGRTIPCEFIGFIKSQNQIIMMDEPVTNHEELMSNFFSQPDALACGKTIKELQEEKCPENLLHAKEFLGDKPSLSLLIDELNPFSCGQLLAMYEHRTSIEGFIWDINSYDQFGVELGKVLAKTVRNVFQKHQGTNESNLTGFQFNQATKNLIEKFIQNK